MQWIHSKNIDRWDNDNLVFLPLEKELPKYRKVLFIH